MQHAKLDVLFKNEKEINEYAFHMACMFVVLTISNIAFIKNLKLRPSIKERKPHGKSEYCGIFLKFLLLLLLF